MSAMGKIDAERLARISGQLDPQDAEWLAEQLLDRREQAARRRAERDRLIVTALDRLDALPPTVAARRLALLLDNRARAFDGPSPAPGSMEETADQILQLNGYATLQWRAIHGIGVAKKNRCNREGSSLQPGYPRAR